jgi:hypothetical protein
MLDPQVKDLYLEGKTVKEIEKIVNRSKSTVISWLKQLGVYDKNRDYLTLNYTNLDFFNKIDTEEKAYWLGFIYADGCIFSCQNPHSKKLTIDLGIKDKDHLQKLSDIFNKPLNQFKSSPHLIWLVISKNQVYTDLLNNGIEERKTYSTSTTILSHVPNIIMNHFIRGYFDGDGWTHHNKYHYKFGLCGTKEFLSEIQKILIQKIQTRHNIPIYKKQIFELNYESQADVLSIYNWLYKNATVWLERKRDKFKEMIEVIIPKDRICSPYKGAQKQISGRTWRSQITFNKEAKHIKNCESELEAAYWYDLEQVRLRREEAIYHMNFPSQYDNFVQCINDGIK